MAPVLNIDFSHTMLEAISYLVFFNSKDAASIGKYHLNTGKFKLF